LRLRVRSGLLGPLFFSATASRSSSGQRSSAEGMRACFLAVALLLLGAPLAQAAVSSAEHNALVDLYNSTNGASWTNKSNWMVAADECTWYGVVCNGDEGHRIVQALYLSGNNLNGILPGSLGSLASLQTLTLNGNQLSGSIPPELGSLASLQWLFLDSNQLSGSIPPQLGSLASLQILALAANQLSGGASRRSWGA
jgi:hypothetical protein